MKTRTRTHTGLAGWFWLALLIPGNAADVTWTNAAGDGDWGNAENWSSGTIPSAEDTAVFPGSISGDSAYEVFLNGDREIGSITFSGSGCTPVLQGMAYTLTVHGGRISGGRAPAFRTHVRFAADTTVQNGDTWGGSISFLGGAEGDVQVTATGHQNHNVVISNGVWSVTRTILNSSSLTLMDCVATNITLGLAGTFSDSIGNSASMNLYTTANLKDSTIEVFNNGGNLNFNNTVETAADDRTEVALNHIQGALGLTLNWYGGTNLVVFREAKFSGPAYVRMKYERRNGQAPQLSYGENIGFFFPTVEVESATSAYNGRFVYDFIPTKRNEFGAVVSSGSGSDYISLGESGPYAPGHAYWKWSEFPWTLEETLTMLLFFDLSGGDADYFIGENDWRLTLGAIFTNTSASKRVRSSGGRVIFGADNVYFYLGGGGDFEISAPIAWERPDSVAEDTFPSLVISGTSKENIIFSGEDQIRDWYGVVMDCGRVVSTIHFAGDSDRVIHGPLIGRNNTASSGTGTLTLAGPDSRRWGAHSCYAGTTVLAHPQAPSPSTITNGAVCYVADGIAHQSGGTIAVHAGGQFGMQGEQASARYVWVYEDGCVAGGAPGETGVLRLETLRPQADFIIRQKFGPETQSGIAVNQYYPLASQERIITIAVEDVSGGQRILSPSDVFPVLIASRRDGVEEGQETFLIENLSPGSFDTSAAEVWLDSSDNTIYLTGLRSLQGTLLVVH